MIEDCTGNDKGDPVCFHGGVMSNTLLREIISKDEAVFAEAGPVGGQRR
jgi:hypothetical protein